MSESIRKSWDDYFLTLAELVATRATCDRLHAGCILVRDNRIISTGYNGSMPGAKHCDDVGHSMSNGHCIKTIHAEINAIANAARVGISTVGALAYITHSSCWSCIKSLVASGVKRILCKKYYENAVFEYPEDISKILEEVGVDISIAVNKKNKYLTVDLSGWSTYE